MTSFRNLLITLTLAVWAYTAITVTRFGINIAPIFFGDMAALTWRGQFALDFLTYLLLSAVWISWRDGFTRRSLVLAPAAMILGMSFLGPYLLYLFHRHQGDLPTVLLGVNNHKHAKPSG